MGDAEELDRVLRRMETLCNEALNSNSTYLLSQLGKDMGSDLLVLKRVTKLGLGAAIRSNLATDFEVVGTGAFGNIQAVVRKGSPAPATATPPTAREDAPPRFNHRFWAAFSIPLAGGHRRYLDPATFIFSDLEGEGPSGSWEVRPEDVAPQEAERRDREIESHIQKWAKEKGLDVSEFYKRSPPHDVVAPVSRSLLHVLLSSLDKRQLAATAMPLDVVETLLRKRI